MDLKESLLNFKKKYPYVLFEDVENVGKDLEIIVRNDTKNKDIFVNTYISGNDDTAIANYEFQNSSQEYLDELRLPIIWSQNKKEN